MTREERRDAKRRKARYGMQMSGRSVQKLQELTVSKAANPGQVNRKRKRQRVR